MFSQMKDIKHIKQEFHTVAWVMPQVWDFVGLGVPRGSKKCWWPWGEVKSQISLNSSYKVNFIFFFLPNEVQKFAMAPYRLRVLAEEILVTH